MSIDLRELDVACGIDNPAVPAKAGAIMTGVDIVPNLLEQANIRAQREGGACTVRCKQRCATAPPDVLFDLVVSKYGVRFAPRAGNSR